MLPNRFRIIGPYVAAYLQPDKPRPPLSEFLYYLCRPGKERRASRYIERTEDGNDYWAITFKGFPTPFYYPKVCSWTDLSATIDESFDPKNWHHYLTDQTPLRENDVVLDCGAAEGLFTFICAQKAAKIFAFEPLPTFVTALKRNFAGSSNVVIHPCGLGHKDRKARITDNQIFSAISTQGPIEIEMKTLDQMILPCSESITFLKADVEGFEFELLLGAEELIRAYRPKIAVTVYHQTNNVCEITNFLAGVRPDYNFSTKGISEHGGAVMLHAW